MKFFRWIGARDARIGMAVGYVFALLGFGLSFSNGWDTLDIALFAVGFFV